MYLSYTTHPALEQRRASYLSLTLLCLQTINTIQPCGELNVWYTRFLNLTAYMFQNALPGTNTIKPFVIVLKIGKVKHLVKRNSVCILFKALISMVCFVTIKQLPLYHLFPPSPKSTYSKNALEAYFFHRKKGIIPHRE